jgi:sulfonate transport system permease protein
VPLVILHRLAGCLRHRLSCPARVMPAPTDVAVAGWKLLQSGELAQNIWVSFWRASVGFLIGGSIGFRFRPRQRAVGS